MNPRFTVALATAALVTLAGCGGSSTDGAPSGAGSAAPTNSAAPTSPATAPTATPSSRAVTAAVSPERAGSEATRLLTAAGQAVQGTGPTDASARNAAWTGQGLRAADGDARLASAKVRRPRADHPILSPVRPNVLAVSRGKSYPQVMVVQTTPGHGAQPQLHLVRADNTKGGFRIAATTSMLPGTSVKAFAPIAQGSNVAVPGDDSSGAKSVLGSLATSPGQLLSAYAKHLSYPRRQVDHPTFASSRFASQVRDGAAQQAKDVASQASFTQSHKVLDDSVVTVRQRDGGALVFAAIQRTDTFKVRPGQSIKPTKAFRAFEPHQAKIEDSASMQTVEFVTFAVPPGQGKATLVAASEHLVGAKGH